MTGRRYEKGGADRSTPPRISLWAIRLRADRLVAVGSDNADHAGCDDEREIQPKLPRKRLSESWTGEAARTLRDGRGGNGSRTKHQSRRCESDKRFTNNHLVPFRLYSPLHYHGIFMRQPSALRSGSCRGGLPAVTAIPA